MCSISFPKTLSLLLFLAVLLHTTHCRTHHHTFVVRSTPYTRLCSTKNILTVNGKFPGPTLTANRGDKLIVKFHNQAEYNLTLHWHGVKQPRNPWSDGVVYVNQCPVRPGKKFSYKIELTDEEGTIWWHAHSGWARATIHGMFIILPRKGHTYPFPKPYGQLPIILGEWWKTDVMEIALDANKTGRQPISSDAYTINGQPGDFYPCSKQDTFRMKVKQGKTYLLRVVNAAMEANLFFSVAQHKLTVVATDGCYTKPLLTNYIMITPGQTMDLLMEANQPADRLYYVAASPYVSASGAGFDQSKTTAILHYEENENENENDKPPPLFPTLFPYNDTRASTQFSRRLRSLATKQHPIQVPTKVDTNLLVTVSVNLINCTGSIPCTGPFGKRFAASLNNISLVDPSVDVLQAYYYGIKGVFGTNFPKNPPKRFDYTGGDGLAESVLTPDFGMRALVLEYGANVEMVLQGTNLLASDNHPMHLHGYSFYVVGWGFGNFDPEKDPAGYNLVDPPQVTTVGIPNNGWAAIRFKADNPGVWFMHCHLDRHQFWGMDMVIIVKDGDTPQSKILPPPSDLPTC